MVQAREPSGLPILRSILVRLSTATKASQLPRLVLSQIQAIKECSDVLSQPRNTSQAGGEAGVVVHNFHTRIATLLQGRSTEERWSAAIMIKATVEAGGYECLSRSKHWVSGLLSNLRKPDPPSTRSLYITTLTRIFTLTWEYPSLVRDITTQALSPFIKTCLQNVRSESRDTQELRTVLESFVHLIPRHHTTFRTHAKDLELLAGTEAGLPTSTSTGQESLDLSTANAAARLVVTLHGCEPKQGHGPAWEAAVDLLIESVHRHADVVLGIVTEDLDSALSSVKSATLKTLRGRSVPERLSTIYLSTSRLEYGLRVLTHYITNDSTGVVSIPLTKLHVLIERLLAVVVGSSPGAPAPRFSGDAGREERDASIQVIPRLHVSALTLLACLLHRFGDTIAQLTQSILPQMRWVFQGEHDKPSIRRAVYEVLSQVVASTGPSWTKDELEISSSIIKTACDDAMGSSSSSRAANLAKGSATKDDGLLKTASTASISQASALGVLEGAATAFLVSVYSYIPPNVLPQGLRSQMDRTIILSRREEAMVASILYPGKKSSGTAAPSLLPFLAGLDHDMRKSEALLRPRMPVLQSGILVPYQSLSNGFSEGSERSAIDTRESEAAEAEDYAPFIVTDANDAHAAVLVESAPIQSELASTVPNPSTILLESQLAESASQKRSAEATDTLQSMEKRQKLNGGQEPLPNDDREVSHESLSDMVQAPAQQRLETMEAHAELSNEVHEAAQVERIDITSQEVPGKAESNQPDAQPADSDDDDDFVIPDLTMDVSDSEEDAAS
jgi:pre-rRNA-processing protein RIX1